MSRIRSVHPGFFRDDRLVPCSAFARLLFIGLGVEADDKGIFEWKPVTLKMSIFPGDSIDVVPLLDELIEAGSVMKFEAAGRAYGAIRNFRKFQKPKTPNDIHPMPDHVAEYVAFPRKGEIEAVEADPFPTSGEKSPQMEDEGGRRDDEGGKKTTLSADPNRKLIGDDEHGWTDENTVFNFEGGCYAKVVNLSEENEPDIFRAIKKGAILENVVFKEGTNEVDFQDVSITPNTRVSYPIYHIDNIQQNSIGENPKNIFFLTADSFGIIPPISKLTPGQAAYHFISGYTAKVAGTEAGVTEPQPNFSACFGAPFMPLHPTKYAEMLSKKMKDADVKVWLINTGWTGGPYGIGSRMKLKYTRAMITAALNGELDAVEYENHEVFGIAKPLTCPNVPSEILNPRNTWEDPELYDKKAVELAQKFKANFEKFSAYANDEIMAGAPIV